MRQVILLLIACMQQAQMVFGPANMVIGRPSDPIVVGMAGGAIAHNAGDYIEGFSEWFHCDPSAADFVSEQTGIRRELIERALVQLRRTTDARSAGLSVRPFMSLASQ
jgi:hypothetical protein